MSQLQPVTLSFDGRDYTVDKEDSIWGLIEAIEDVVSFLELAPALGSGKYPTAKIFRAYAAALNYAGAKVTANDVRAASDYQKMGEMAGALVAITMMAQPGSDINLGEPTANEKDTEEVKKKAEGE